MLDTFGTGDVCSIGVFNVLFVLGRDPQFVLFYNCALHKMFLGIYMQTFQLIFHVQTKTSFLNVNSAVRYGSFFFFCPHVHVEFCTPYTFLWSCCSQPAVTCLSHGSCWPAPTKLQFMHCIAQTSTAALVVHSVRNRMVLKLSQ